MALLLLIPALLLMPITALAVMRSAWGRHALAYACLGLATALPLWFTGCTKDTQQTRSHEGSEHDADRDRKANQPDNQPQQQAAESPASPALAFHIAADPTATDLQPYKTRLDEEGPRDRADAKYRWFVVDDLEQYVDDPAQRREVAGLLARSQDAESSDGQVDARRQIEAIFASREVVARPYAGRLYLLLHNDDGFAMTRDDDWAVSNVNRGMDELNRATVNYSLDAKGASLMRSMTRPNVGRPMAVLIDNKVLTTPNINSALSSNVQISGEFSEAEIRYLLDSIRRTESGRSP